MSEINDKLKIKANIFNLGSESSLAINSLKKLVKLAEVNSIELVLFISPYHSEYLESLVNNGHWAQVELWKRILVEITMNSPVATLYDFNSIEPYNSAVVSNDVGINFVDPWFWEPAHYRSAVGERILATIYKDSCEDTVEPFPMEQLDSSNITDHQMQLRKKLFELPLGI